MAAGYRIGLPPVTPGTADARTREVLETAKARVGFVPNMYANMANLPALLETYLSGYQRFREEAGFSPAEQEVVFLAISRENGCSYCTSAHSMLAAKKSGVPEEVLAAIREDREIPDPKLRALYTFARTLVRKRGLVDEADVRPFLDAGYDERHILGIVLAAAVKTLSNWTNHLFHTELDPVFAPFAWSPPGERAA